MQQPVQTQMPIYDEESVQPMRDELIAYGFDEARTPEELDRVLSPEIKGTTLVFVNSVCGCAAGSARPGVGAALQHSIIPDRFVTVFAGQDRDAVDRLRQHYLSEYPPSSPSIALFQDGEVVHMMHRSMIEGRSPMQVAEHLMQVFDKLCHRQGPSIAPEQFEQIVQAVFCGSSIPLNR